MAENLSWSEMEQHDSFKSLSFEDKQKVRDEFFMTQIAPKVKPGDLNGAYGFFLQEAPIQRDNLGEIFKKRVHARATQSVGGAAQALGESIRGDGTNGTFIDRVKKQFREAKLGPLSAFDPHGFPIDLDRPTIKNEDGTESSEKTITVGFGDRFYNIPTIWDGKEVSQDKAIANARDGLKEGAVYPNFSTEAEALEAAPIRSAHLGTLRDVGGNFDFAMGEIGRSLTESATLIPDIVGEAFNTAAVATQSGQGVVDLLAKGGAGIAETGSINLQSAGDYGIRRPDDITDEPTQALKFYGTQIGESFIGNMLPSMMIGAINRRAGLGSMGAIVFGEEYAKLRADGADESRALKIAGFRAAAEVAFEGPAFDIAMRGSVKFLGPAFNRALKSGGKVAKGVKRVGGTALIEGISEDFTEISNILFDKYALDQITTPDQFASRMKDAFVAGVGMGVPMAGTGMILDGLTAQENTRLQADIDELLRQYYGKDFKDQKRLGWDNIDLYDGTPTDELPVLPDNSEGQGPGPGPQAGPGEGPQGSGIPPALPPIPLPPPTGQEAGADQDIEFVDNPPEDQAITDEDLRGLEAEVEAELKAAEIDDEANQAATSPENDLDQPTDGQKDAGNYKKGHLSLHGFDIAIENPAGSVRKGKGWEVTLQDHYGYIKGTEANDGDQVDVFLAPNASDENPNVAIVDQRDPKTGEFDESKIIIGYEEGLAQETYFRNYAEDFKQTGVFAGLTEISMDELQAFIKTGNLKEPFGEFTPALTKTEDRQDEDEKGPHGPDEGRGLGKHEQGPRQDETLPEQQAGGELGNGRTGSGSRQGSGPQEGVEPLRGEEPGGSGLDQPPAEPSQPDETGGGGALAPPTEPAKPTEYAPLDVDEEVAFDAPTVVNQIEAIRKGLSTEGEVQKAAEEHLHQAIGLAIEGKLSAASIRLSLASSAIVESEESANAAKAITNVRAVLSNEVERQKEADQAPPVVTPPEQTDQGGQAGKTDQTEKKKKTRQKGKLQNTGEDLRRWWDKLKAEAEAAKTSGEKLWHVINLSTQRGKVFNPKPGPNATPGVQRYYNAVQRQLNTFIDVATQVYHTDFGGNLKSYSNNVSQYITARLNKPDTYPKFQALLVDFAADYARMMNEFSAYMSGANTVSEAESKLQKIIETDGWGPGYRSIELSVDRESIPHMVFVDAKEPTDEDRKRAQEKKYYTVTEPEVLIPIPTGGATQAQRLSHLMIGKKSYDSDNADNGNWKGRGLKEALRNEKETEDPDAKKRLTRPRFKEHEREMPKSVRDGNVTPQQFKDEFGFADVGFGNWVAKGKDQVHLNGAWDSFADLADFMGIDRKAIGNYGEIHFTIGALGHGKAAAHFSPNQPSPSGSAVPVINVTNTSGDGTVSHEWGHAFDHQVLRDSDEARKVLELLRDILKVDRQTSIIEQAIEEGIHKRRWMSNFSYSGAKGSVENVTALVNYRVRNMPATSFKKNADALGKSYWGNDAELLARSWEAFVYDNLGGTNNYLVSSWAAEDEVGKGSGYRGTPYPQGEERQLFADVYKALLKAITTEGGSTKISYRAFEDALPESISGFEEQVEMLIANIPGQIEALEKAQREEEAEAKRKKQQDEAEAWVKAAEDAAGESEIEKKIETAEEEDRQELRDAGDVAGTIDDEAPISNQDLRDLEAQIQAERDEEQQAPGPDTVLDDLASGKISGEAPPIAGDKPDRTAGEAAKSAGGNLKEAVKESLKALDEIFKPGGTVNMGFIIDPDRYAKAKPHFAKSLEDIRKAGGDLRDLISVLMENFGEVWSEVKEYFFAWVHEEGLSMSLKEPATSPDQSTPPEKTLHSIIWSSFDDITNNKKLRSVLAEFHGEEKLTEVHMKQGQEAYEAVLVVKAREIVAYGRSHNQRRRVIFDKLVDLYNKQINLDRRSSTSIENQAYSTPMPLAFLASELAGISNHTSVYEPTAGNGALLIGANPNLATINELDYDRAKNLRDLGFINTTEHDATNWKPATVVDAAIMNPPFGAMENVTRVDGYQISAIDHLIASVALDTIKDDGKAVLILGANRDTGQQIKGSKKIFLNWLYSRYNVVDHFEVSGDLYRKQGAGWPVMVITIDGRGSDATHFDAQPKRLTNWNEIYEHTSTVLDTQRRIDPATGSNVRADAQADQSGGTRTRSGSGLTQTGEGTGGAAGEGGGVPGRGRDREGHEPGTVQRGNRSGRTGVHTGGVGSTEDGGTSPDTGRVGGSGATASGQGSDFRGEADRSGDARIGSDYQVPYVPRSSGLNENILVPKFMVDAMHDALNVIETAVGMGVDKYVQSKLGYPSIERMHDVFFALQVDAIAAAIYNLEKKNRGVIVADQTGVGKGRQAAGMIRYALRHGYTPVFITAQANLFTDIYDDLLDIGERSVRPFIFNSDGYVVDRNDESNKLFRHKKSTKKGKVVLDTRKQGLSSLKRGVMPAGNNAIFITYSQFNTVNAQRASLQGILDSGMKPMFIMDESHKAAGERSKPGKDSDGNKVEKTTGAGFAFDLIKDAPVMYLSATYAKRADNMPIYHRTDMFDAVDSVDDLEVAINKGGPALQTVLARMLSLSGQLFRRELSFEGISFPTKIFTKGKEKYVRQADALTTGLRDIVGVDKQVSEWIKENQQYVLDELGNTGGEVGAWVGSRAESMAHHPFVSIVHNFVRQFLLSMKADILLNEAIEVHRQGGKPIIALENTMESFLKQEIDDGAAVMGEEWKGDYRSILYRALDNTRRLAMKDSRGNIVKIEGKELRVKVPLDIMPTHLQQQYTRSRALIDSLPVQDIVLFYIDYIRNGLEKAGIRTSEITGRSYMLDYSGDGAPVVTHRPASESKNRRGVINKFNNGSFEALILNAAGSTGLSIHASEKFTNLDGSPQKQRVMLVGQAMGDINILMQMFGRINRTGQLVLPKYVMVGLELPAETRPMAMTAKKMRSLNANTSANTESETTLKDVPDMFNQYGDEIVNDFLRENEDIARVLNLEKNVSKEGAAPLQDIANKATGRLALLPHDTQAEVWETIIENYTLYIQRLDAMGTNTLNVVNQDLDAKIKRNMIMYHGKDPTTIFGGNATLHQVSVKLTGRPPKGETVLKAVADSLDGASPAAKTKELLDFLEDRDERSGMLEKALDEAKEKQRGLTNERRDLRRQRDITRDPDGPTKQQLADAAKEDSLNKKIGVEGAQITALRDQIHTRKEHIREVRRMVSTYTLGSAWKMDVGDDLVTGVLTNIKSNHQEGRGDPYARSSIVLTFMVTSPTARVPIPLSQINNGYIESPLHNITQERLKNLFDSQYRGRSREDRYVITGNLISGYAELDGTGQVVTFTGGNGKLYIGILLPRNFAKKFGWEKQQNKPIILRGAEEAFGYMQALSKTGDNTLAAAGLTDRTQEVRLYKDRWNDVYHLSIRARNSKPSRKVMGDSSLRSIVGNFAGARTLLEAEFPGHRLRDVLDRLIEINTLYAPSSGKSVVEQVTGRVIDDPTETNLSFDDGAQDKSLEWQPENLRGDESKARIERSESLPRVSQTIKSLFLRFNQTIGKSSALGQVDINAEYVRKILNGRTNDKGELEQGSVESILNPKLSRAQVAAVERIFNKKVVFFRVKGGDVHQGFVTSRNNKTIYVNIDAVSRVSAIVGHELWHTIENENPELAAELVNALTNNFNLKPYLEALAKDYGVTPDEITQKFATSEIMGDLMGDLLSDEAVLRSLENDSPSTLLGLLQRIVEWMARVLDRMTKRGLGAGNYFKDMDAATEAVKETLKEYRDNPVPQSVVEEGGSPYEPETVSFSIRDELRQVAERVWTRRTEKFFDEKAQRLSRWYSPLGGLPNVREFLIKRYLTLGKLGKIDLLAKRIGEAFDPKLSRGRKLIGSVPEAQRLRIKKTKQQVYEFLIDPRGLPKDIHNPAARRNAVKIKKILDEVGQNLVDAGLLSEEAYLEHKDGYLPQLYLKYLLLPQVYSDLGLSGKVSSMGYRKERVLTDPDDPEEAVLRRVILGEVKDPGFLASVSIGRAMRDMAMLDFMRQIQEEKDEGGVDPLWVHPDFLIEWEGKTVTVFWLQAEADRLWNQARHADSPIGDKQDKTFIQTDDAKDMRDLAERMREAVAEREEETERDTKDYRQMPNRPQFGRLRGLWVRKEIHADLVGIAAGRTFNKESVGKWATLLEGMFSVHGRGSKINQWWKVMKVPLNPPTQFRNFFSNMILLNLSGIPMDQLPGLLVDALGQMKNNGQYYRIAMKWGVSKSTFASNELATLHTELIKIRKDHADGSSEHFLSSAGLAWAHIVEAGSNVYQKMETLGKTMKIMHEMKELGHDEATAALEAHKTLFDYSLIPNAVRWARNSPFGMPFITFQYKILPNMLETMIKYPWRLAPYAALPFAMSALLAALFDTDDDDLKKLKKALPLWMHDKGHMYLLPYKTDDGRWDVFDFSFFLPWSMYTETAEELAKGNIQSLFTETGLFSGPIAQTIMAVKTNTDPYGERKIWDKNDPIMWQIFDLLTYAWSLGAPSWTTEPGAVGKIFKKMGWTRLPAFDASMRTTVPWSHIPLKMVGVNVYRVDPDLTREQNLYKMNGIIRDRLWQAKLDIEQPGIGEVEMEKRIIKWRNDIEPREQEMLDYMRQSKFSDKLR